MALVLPLLVPYYHEVPSLHSSRVGPLLVSPKSLAYLLAVQVSLSSPSSLVTGCLCLLSGALTFLTPLSTLTLPSALSKCVSLIMGPLLSSSPPPSVGGLLGATLEIQRTQQAEAIEEQVLRSRQRFNVVSILNI